MPTLPEHRITPSFHTRSLRPGLVPMGHFLNVDHFHMSEPTFPPHPHAGFSAVTVMLPWSPGGFVNRDSRGDRSRIAPGAVHWTLAGAGMLHEEIPEVPGTDCEGLQIFVKLPEALETSPPSAHHLAPEDVPVVVREGGSVRVLVGALDGARSPLPSHARTTLLHVHAEGTVTLEVPAGVEAFAIALRGSGTLDGSGFRAGEAVALAAPTITIAGHGLDVLVGHGDPLPRTPTFQGPFCMFRAERLAEAFRAYRAGALGVLAPSPVSFVR